MTKLHIDTRIHTIFCTEIRWNVADVRVVRFLYRSVVLVEMGVWLHRFPKVALRQANELRRFVSGT